MNPFLKNCRTGFHNDVLNRTSHYCKLLSIKTTISNKLSNKYGYLLEQKGQKETQAKRQKTNDDLMKSLIFIEKKQARYRSANQLKVQPKKSLKSEYLEKKKGQAISQDNFRLYKRIMSPETEFSNDKIKDFDSKITKYSKLIKHPFQQICQMDKEFYRTYRHQQFQARTSPEKRSAPSSYNSDRLHEVKAVKNKKNKKFRNINIGKDPNLDKAMERNPEKSEQL